ncbi:hypothetical protein [Streptomyces zagrosensis]|uniref:Lipoprotein n=1 Tax=Streptomyces zagrosensis TaxID=1042984 RepID=A0A7W9UY40_9ACTN|nr:hypothetical protein [Streptomyces zagrosensis]MBB5935535.1 hypothetical protein [Streptomyces zagrosensis]
MSRRRMLVATVALLLTAGCSSADAGGTSESSSPPPGARDAVKRYVEALNDRDVKALLDVGSAPDKPWSRKQADEIIRSKGGKGLTIMKAPIRYDLMGEYMGTVSLATSDSAGRSLRETVELMHEKSHWHVVLFEWPSGDKETSAT